jgi:hypothetical protein
VRGGLEHAKGTVDGDARDEMVSSVVRRERRKGRAAGIGSWMDTGSIRGRAMRSCPPRPWWGLLERIGEDAVRTVS